MFFFMLGWHVLVWSLSCFFYSSLYFLIWLPVRALLIPAWAIFLMSLSAACRAQGHRDTHWRVGRSSCCNWDKYIWQLGQIYFCPFRTDTFEIWTNTFDNWDKYILQLGQIHFPFGRDTFEIWTNTFRCLWSWRTQGHTPGWEDHQKKDVVWDASYPKIID